MNQKEKFSPKDDRFIAGWNAAIKYVLTHLISRMIAALKKLLRE